MADIADIADIAQENHLAATIFKARTAKPVLTANGSCHSCDESLPPGRLFCDKDCQEDWERVQSANARAGRSTRVEALME